MPVNILNLAGLNVLDFKDTATDYHVRKGREKGSGWESQEQPPTRPLCPCVPSSGAASAVWACVIVCRHIVCRRLTILLPNNTIRT